MRINTTAIINSAIVTVWFVTVSAIASEIFVPLKNFFVSVANHHWTGKSVIAMGIFLLMYFVLSVLKESDHPEKEIRNLMVNTVLGGLMILGYFIWHYLSV